LTTTLLLCTCACVRIGAALTVWMFRRRDEFAGLVGLTVLTVGGFVAVVYGSLTSD